MPGGIAEKPHIARFCEALAAILGLYRGRRRLELVFEQGRLCEWRVSESRQVADLAEWDAEAEWLVIRRQTVVGEPV